LILRLTQLLQLFLVNKHFLVFFSTLLQTADFLLSISYQKLVSFRQTFYVALLASESVHFLLCGF
jgi:hypothetical protein